MYAFGCVLYEILSGRIVFPADNTKEVLHQHLVATPTPPSFIRPCDASLEELCLRLLSKNPKERPTAIEVLEKLSLATSIKYTRAPITMPLNTSKPLGLIGRQEELRRLEEERLSSASGPRLVLLGAESGLGKSSLLSEFALLSQEKKANVWWGRCYEREDIPYKAFDAIVDSLTAALARRQSEGLLIPGIQSLTKIFPVLKEAPNREPLRQRSLERAAACLVVSLLAPDQALRELATCFVIRRFTVGG
jgi:serine/threonine protein kinase